MSDQGKILVLDDEANYVQMLYDLLDQRGFDAEMMTNPIVALERIHEEEFDLVIADYKMPEMNGVEFLKEVRKSYPKLPVIMISGFMNAPELLKVANIGVTLVLKKPFDLADFLENVRRFAAPRGERRGKEDGVPKKSAAHAVRMPEFEAELRVNYPQPLRQFSAQSRSSKHFVQSLWVSIHRARHHFLAVPPGGDFDLLVKEVAFWIPYAQGHVESFNLADFATGEGQKRLTSLANLPDRNPLIAVTVPSRGSRGIDAAGISRMIELAVETPAIRERLHFIYSIPEAEAPTLRMLGFPNLAQRLVGDKLVRLPALRERALDIAVYTARYLMVRGGQQDRVYRLQADAAALLVTYPWLHNYVELLSVLEQMTTSLEDEKIERSHLEQALSAVGSRLPDDFSVDIGSFLRRKQLDFFRREISSRSAAMVGNESDLSVDSEADVAPASTLPPLVFPELLDG